MIYLFEANVIGILPEALPAHVEAILANQTMAIGAHTAGKKMIRTSFKRHQDKLEGEWV